MFTDLDWKKIAEKYPKASKAKDKWSDKGGRIPYKLWCSHGAEFELRYLYDFFDKKRIWVSVLWDVADELPWTYAVDYDGLTSVDGTSKYNIKTRKSAEKQAFTEAFKVLERQLTKKK